MASKLKRINGKMAAGSDGLQIALVILGLLIHLQPEKTDHTDLVDVKAEN